VPNQIARAIVITGFVVALLAGCAFEVTRNVPALLLAIDGAVSTSPPTEALVENTHLQAPSSIITAGNGRADLSLVPGVLIQLEADSELQLMRLQLTKNGNRIGEAMRRDVLISLRRGALHGVVQFETELSPVRISTRDGMVVVLAPALFRVETRDAKTRVTCARGSLRFEPNSGAPMTLEGEAFCEWPSDHAESMPAQFDVLASNEIENLREVERKLLGLQDRSRLAPYPWRQ
jgi:hypothetical protein